MSIVHRDMTVAERKKLESRQKDIESLIGDLEVGDVHPEDLDPELLARLEQLLRKRGK
jgi:superfamily I DNA and RNA helicase